MLGKGIEFIILISVHEMAVLRTEIRNFLRITDFHRFLSNDTNLYTNVTQTCIPILIFLKYDTNLSTKFFIWYQVCVTFFITNAPTLPIYAHQLITLLIN